MSVRHGIEPSCHCVAVPIRVMNGGMKGIARWVGGVAAALLLAAAGEAWAELEVFPVPPKSESGGPVEVEIAVHLNKIYNVDTVGETYMVDGYRVIEWRDPRVKALVEKTGNDNILFENEQVMELLGGTVWHPVVEFINIVGGPTIPHRSLRLWASGKVRLDERFHGTFTSDMDFRKFPFDSQDFEIQIESFTFDVSEVIFTNPRAFPESLDESHLVEWHAEKPVVRLNTGDYTINERTVFARYNLIVRGIREPGYYIWQVFLPLFIIIGVSWVVFWVRSFGDQLGTAFTLMLTVVAFNFYTSTLLPRLPYNTFIEAVIISGYGAISVAILLIVAGHVLQEKGREKTAERFARLSRWGYPLGGLLTFALIVVRFFG